MVPLNHQLVVLVFFSNMFVVSKHISDICPIHNLNVSTTACTYLHFRCLLSNRYGNSFGMVIMLSLLISNTLTCISLLHSNIVIFCILSGKINLDNGYFCHLG